MCTIIFLLMKIDTTENKILKFKKIGKVFYYKVILMFFLVFSTSLAVFSQEYLQIKGTKKVFRYFSDLKKSDEAINDSTTVSIWKQKNIYNLHVLINGKKNTECLYSFNGQTVPQNLRVRVFNKKGNKFIVKKIIVKILVPVNDDCIKHLIPN
jgi:hypothetical protein